MLPKTNRLARNDGFGQVIQSGVRVGSRQMIIYYLPGDPSDEGNLSDEEEPKVGVTVGKRQVPKAADRNRLKRQLRHLAAARLTTLPAGSKAVVRGLKDGSDIGSRQLGQVMDRLLARAVKSSGTGKGQASD